MSDVAENKSESCEEIRPDKSSEKELKYYIIMSIAVVVVCLIALVWPFLAYLTPYQAPTSDLVRDSIAVHRTNFGMALTFWRRLDNVLKILAIVSGVSTVVVASLSNKYNAERIKVLTVTFTLITSIVSGIYASFNVHDQIDSLYKASSAFGRLDIDYTLAASQILNSGGRAILVHDYKTKIMQILDDDAAVRTASMGVAPKDPR